MLKKLLGRKYPTEWEEDTRELEKTVYRKKVKIKLDNGEQMTFEADLFDSRYSRELYRDIEDINIVVGHSRPITQEEYGDWEAEIESDEIVAKETEIVEKHTYKFEVDYKRRKVEKDNKTYCNYTRNWKWEVEILDIRQIDTEQVIRT